MINITSSRGKQKARAEILRAMTLLEASGARDIRPILNRQFLSAARSVAVGSYNVNAAVNSQRGRMIVAFKRNYRRTATVFNQMAMGKLGAAGAVAGQMLPVSDVEEIIPEVKGSREEFWSALNMSINKDTAKRVTNVGKTTKKRIQNVIKRGMTSKLSNREIAKNLRGISAIANPKRAKVIARTETHGAAMQAIDESVKTAGVKTTKDWIGANDARSRDIPGRGRIHVQATATQKKIPDDKPFIVGGEKLMYPGDFAGSSWNVINCRCAVIYDVVKAAVREARKKPSVEPFGVIDDTPLPRMSEKTVDDRIENLGRDCVNHSLKTKKEMAHIVDIKTGRSVSGAIKGETDAVYFDLDKLGLDPNRKYSIIHSHPSAHQGGLSGGDIAMAGTRKELVEIRAYTPVVDGKRFEYVCKRVAERPFIAEGRTGIGRFTRYTWEPEYEKILDKYASRVAKKKISEETAHRLAVNEVNRNLVKLRKGKFTYTAKEVEVLTPKDIVKMKRAIRTHKPATREIQQLAEKNERRLAKKILGKQLGDNEPFDVIMGTREVPTHLIEVKTIVRGATNKITMHGESLKSKLKQVKKFKGSKAHTVVFDERTGKIYYRKGLGSFRIKSMKEVTEEELKTLFLKPKSKLLREVEWIKDLSREEKQAVFNWAGGSDYFREFQKTGKVADFPGLTKAYRTFTQRLDTALNRAEPYSGKTVWRGLQLKSSKARNKFLKTAKFELDAMSSSSYSAKTASNFVGDKGIMLKIHNRTGVKIDKVVQSQYQHQKEVLLRKGSKYRRIGDPVKKQVEITTMTGKKKVIEYFEIAFEETP